MKRSEKMSFWVSTLIIYAIGVLATMFIGYGYKDLPPNSPLQNSVIIKSLLQGIIPFLFLIYFYIKVNKRSV